MTVDGKPSRDMYDVPIACKSTEIHTNGGVAMRYKNGKLYKAKINGVEIEFSVENLTQLTIDVFNRTLAEIITNRRKQTLLSGTQ